MLCYLFNVIGNFIVDLNNSFQASKELKKEKKKERKAERALQKERRKERKTEKALEKQKAQTVDARAASIGSAAGRKSRRKERRDRRRARRAQRREKDRAARASRGARREERLNRNRSRAVMAAPIARVFTTVRAAAAAPVTRYRSPRFRATCERTIRALDRCQRVRVHPRCNAPVVRRDAAIIEKKLKETAKKNKNKVRL